MDNLTARAERTLRDTFYTGKKRRFDLSKYCGVHKDAHNDLEKAHEQTNGAYPMMDERSKVRHLLDGIHTESLDAAKAAIFADPQIRNDYDAAVDLLQTFVTQAATGTNDARNISAAGSHGGRGGGGGRRSHSSGGGGGTNAGHGDIVVWYVRMFEMILKQSNTYGGDCGFMEAALNQKKKVCWVLKTK